MEVAVGDKVIYSKYSGTEVKRQKGNQTHEKQITRKSAGQLGE